MTICVIVVSVRGRTPPGRCGKLPGSQHLGNDPDCSRLLRPHPNRMILEAAPAPQPVGYLAQNCKRGPTLRPTMTTQGRQTTFEDRAHEVMDALVTAAALVAVADGSVHAIEREELVNCMDEERLFRGSRGLKSRRCSTKERSNSNSEMGLRSSLKPCGCSQAYSRPS
jgi:hypothetical protein